MRGDYLFGPNFTVADAYLFAMLRWANAFDVRMQSEMFGYFERVALRPAVRRSLAEEGLPSSSVHSGEAIPRCAMAAV
jgi:glutathione S-transferase